MPVKFKLDQVILGCAPISYRRGDSPKLIYRELLSPEDPELIDRLEQLHGCIFSKITGLPEPSHVKDLVIIINKELDGLAYIDELKVNGVVDYNKKEAVIGDPIRISDIKKIISIDLGINISPEDAVIIVRSFSWKRSLFFDFGPLHNSTGPRTYDIQKALAQQLSLLLGIPSSSEPTTQGRTRVQEMKRSLDKFDALLARNCKEESYYQKLLNEAPWMFGSSYSKLKRHKKLDDENIPDLTLVRSYDECHDIVELKQPFLKIFKKDNTFASAFHNAWDQAERYLNFCDNQRSYLKEEKDLDFQNPTCILLIGNSYDNEQAKLIKSKEAFNSRIRVMSYQQLKQQAEHILETSMRTQDRNYSPKSTISPSE